MEIISKGTRYNIDECLNCGCRFKFYDSELTHVKYNEQKGKKGCSTCVHCKNIHDYPAYVTGEECVCTAGLECDTVLFSVRNCKEWAGRYEE